MTNVTALQVGQLVQAHDLRLLPTSPGKKAPMVAWKGYVDRLASEIYAELAGHWAKDDRRGAWALLGGGTWCVLDCDNDEAIDLWAERIGDEMAATAQVSTRKGVHYWFRLMGQALRSFNQDADPEAVARGAKYDLKADGGGVMVPPSMHPDDPAIRYTWVRDLSHALPVPSPVLSLASAGASGASGPGGAGEAKGRARSGLAELLVETPLANRGHDWLTAVAGHLAKHIPYQDGFEALVDIVNGSLDDPYPEIGKIYSVWNREAEKPGRQADESNGWLIGDGSRLWSLVKKDGEVVGLDEWAGFDIEALGTYVEDDEEWYMLRITAAHGRSFETTVPGRLFGKTQGFNEWVATFASLKQPSTDPYRRRAAGFRLRDYIQAQNPPKSKLVPYLGDNDGIGHVTPDCIIKDGQRLPLGQYRASQLALTRAKFHYGFDDEEAARAAVRQVLDFHWPEATALFAAWWTLCLVKGEVKRRSSLFPFMAIEASSEAGKTNGFFSMMLELAGSLESQGELTLAATRDRVGAHRNGIVWVDDLTNPGPVLDMVRQSTSEGSRTKKGEDRTSQVTVELVAPILISGESLDAVNKEKALLDRAVVVQVQSPVGRMATDGSGGTQWDQIKAYKAANPNLQRFAGTIVAAIQQRLSMLDDEANRTLRHGVGRVSEKTWQMRVGARMLVDWLGACEWIIEYVDAWAEREGQQLGGDNLLFTEMLPRYLRQHGVPRAASQGIAAYVGDDGGVHVSIPLMADWWRQERTSEREKDLGSQSSIAKQLAQLDCTYRRPRIDNRQIAYWQLPDDIGAAVVVRTGYLLEYLHDGPAGVAQVLPLGNLTEE